MKSSSRSPNERPLQALRIALLGAESTGKTALSRELAAHFCAQGLRVKAVPELLREWCARHDREPRPEEAEAIAREQEARVDEAAARCDIVIADTTALMVAVYGALLHPGSDFHRFVLERLRGYDRVLLTGLDLPWVPDGLHRVQSTRDAVDAQLRELLAREAIAYRVVYGLGPQRLASALAAIDTQLAPELPEGNRRAWTCEKCSDPQCEHQLFTRLVQGEEKK
jgi:nicotinamide riboside kinase